MTVSKMDFPLKGEAQKYVKSVAVRFRTGARLKPPASYPQELVQTMLQKSQKS